jgi:iron complex outermembrane receptor protein
MDRHPQRVAQQQRAHQHRGQRRPDPGRRHRRRCRQHDPGPQAGVPVNSFFTYEHKLVDGKPVYEDVNGDHTINENDLYVDQNGDGIINVDDRRPLHDPAPDWTFGLSNYLSLKRFGLNFTMRAYTGNYVYNNVASNLGTYSEVTRASPFNLHSSVLETNFATPQYLSDWYVEDAAFLRMDNITLDYRFELGGQPWRVFGTLQNAFTITGYSGGGSDLGPQRYRQQHLPARTHVHCRVEPAVLGGTEP